MTTAPQITVSLHGIHPEEIGPHGGAFCVALNDGRLGYGETALEACRDADLSEETLEFETWLWASPEWPFVRPIQSLAGDDLGFLFKF